MNIKCFVFIILTMPFFPAADLTAQADPLRQWPGYRGYLASGVLDNADLPDTFDPEKMINIKWKIKIPGLGLSSPAVWNNNLFITTAVSENDRAGFKPGLYGDVAPVNDSSVHKDRKSVV